MHREPYPSDLGEQEWAVLEPLLPQDNGIGSPRSVQLPEVVNALMYVADNGIKWRAMPHEFLAWQRVYGDLRRWSESGVWEQINQALNRQVRLDAGRAENPSLGLMDSQSVEMAQKGCQSKASTATKRSKAASGT